MDKGDRDSFIEENMGLVGKVCKQFLHRINDTNYMSYDDLKSIGSIGIIKAYDRFDKSAEHANVTGNVNIKIVGVAVDEAYKNLENVIQALKTLGIKHMDISIDSKKIA